MEELKSLREVQLNQIIILGKFKETCHDGIQAVIDKMTLKIKNLENKVAANEKVEDLALGEIKAVFATFIAKISFSQLSICSET